jgi:hypothetical protein
VCRAAADVYLESFPFGSQTAALEAARASAAPVLAFDCPSPFLGTRADVFEGLVPVPATESEYVSRAIELGAAKCAQDEEIQQQLGRRVADHHCGAEWRDQLSAVYGFFDRAVHSATAIPAMQAQDENVDLGLAGWQYKINAWQQIDSQFAHDALRDIAWRLRNLGQYRSAYRILASISLRQHIKPICKLLPHWALTRLAGSPFCQRHDGKPDNSTDQTTITRTPRAARTSSGN